MSLFPRRRQEKIIPYTKEERELIKRLEREDEEREPSADEKEAASREFAATLRAAGIEEGVVRKLVELGPMGIFRQYENDILRFSSPEREKLVIGAANAWCKKLN